MVCLACSRNLMMRAAGLAVAIALFLAPQALGQTVGSNRDALRRGTNPVWVDRDNEQVNVPGDQLARTDVSDRHSSIRGAAKNLSFWEQWFGTSGTGGNSAIADFMTAILELWRFVLFVFLVLIVGVAAYFLLRNDGIANWFRKRNTLEGVAIVERQLAKVSDLPFEMEVPDIGFRAQAERYRQSGDYSKAIVYLFSYLLVELDSVHCIRLERGKTNGAYLRELRRWPSIQSTMREVVHGFERAFFGRHVLTRDEFEPIWAQLPQIEKSMKLVLTKQEDETRHAGQPILSDAGGLG